MTAIEAIASVMDEGEIVRESTQVEKLSKDYYWYSPVLAEELREKRAEAVIRPQSYQTLKRALEAAATARLPVTVRGAGTGNYGQAIPLNGGIVVDLSGLNQILHIEEGKARVQAGTKIKQIEKEAAETNQELTIYPSTFAKASIGGFIAGGSGGIGSVTWGNLWDGNVLSAVVMTVEDEVRLLEVEGEELQHYIHSYGVNGLLLEVTIPLKPKTDWEQTIFSFPDFDSALTFSQELAAGALRKRLVSTMEKGIGDFFLPLKKSIAGEDHLVFTETSETERTDVRELAEASGGRPVYESDAASYRKGLGISDFTWNHTTLWALKADPQWTYLQNFFSPDTYKSQIDTIKARFGEDVLFHFEWLRDKGTLLPAALPLVRYTSKEQLYDVIAFFNDIGAPTHDPHTCLLGAGGWNLQLEEIRQRKETNDPYQLLNQGKLPDKAVRDEALSAKQSS
ncbi:FAD-binding oxidoreductase [Alkalicoccus urumqiensis]|uniref:FAD-linked oxidase n=1 Tax=Alkalicoccus urumqiensis TaxID=1548213 RepID=A0A2P6MJG7_ALKUR|nr:FAD-binding oxidoreductase [Alkalicoccus urumqiensis]PRO66428.1 FAD-linked oxidase [Alkalicoccus urumqiensis]